MLEQDTTNNFENQENTTENLSELENEIKSAVEGVKNSCSSDNVLLQEMEKLKEENAELKDKNLRNIADMENLRKRYEKQISDASKYAVMGLAKDLMTVMDNLGRALDSPVQDMEQNLDLKNMFTGVSMTRDELMNVFKKHHITIIAPAIGDLFDYNQHQAVSHIETDEFHPGIVMQVMQLGYSINERLLRPAMVMVAKAKE